MNIFSFCLFINPGATTPIPSSTLRATHTLPRKYSVGLDRGIKF